MQIKPVTTSEATLQDGNILKLPCLVNYYYLDTDQLAAEAAEELIKITSDSKSVIALDLETTGLDPYLDKILLLQIGTEDNKQYLFDMRRVSPNIVAPILLNQPCLKAGHNIGFDSKFCKVHLGVSLTNLFDTLLAEKIIRGGEYKSRFDYTLDGVLLRRLGKDLTIETRSFVRSEDGMRSERAKKQMQRSFLEMNNASDLTTAQLAYAAMDVAYGTILELVSWQIDRLKEPGTNILRNPEIESIKDPQIKEEYSKLFPAKLSLYRVALLEFKFLEVIVEMELAGIKFSRETHAEVLNNIKQDYLEYREEFLSLLGKITKQKTLFGTAAVNPDSTQQVLEALNQLNLKLEDTSYESLEGKLLQLKKDSIEYKVVKCLLSYRGMSKLMSGFGDKLVKHVHPVTGRIHCDTEQILVTGRMSTKKPNIQQIPKEIEWKLSGETEKDATIKSRLGFRECFQAGPGKRLVVYDYSAQELRVAAAVTFENTMLKAFRDDKDLHTYSATLMYDSDYDELLEQVQNDDEDAKQKRKEAKTVSFGSLYGSGPKNLAEILRVPIDKAKDIINRFWFSYPSLKNSMIRYGEVSNSVGYSNTVIGRRRYYVDIQDRMKWIKMEKNPATIEDTVTSMNMPWLLEDGPVTEDNMWQIKKQLIRQLYQSISRQAANHVIQGTSADITKLAAVYIFQRLKKNKISGTIIGMVHDEIIVECPTEDADKCSETMRDCMKKALNVFCPNVPAEVEGKISQYWSK